MAELLKPGDVARVLNVSTSTVRRWIIEGHVASIRTPGGQYRIHASEVDRLLHINQMPDLEVAVA